MSKTASLVCRLICGPAGSMSEGGFWISGGVAVIDEDEDCASDEEEFWARDGLGWRMPEARRVSARSCGASARRLREDCINKGLGVSLRKRRKQGQPAVAADHFAHARPSANLPAVMRFWTFPCDRSIAPALPLVLQET